MDYLDVSYSEEKKPFTTYPSKYAKYLQSNIFSRKEGKLLDLGCGRGEYLTEFDKLSYDVYGVDISSRSKELKETFEVKKCNFNYEKIPYPDNTFDIVFSKSVIEHITSTDFFMSEILRVLKVDGEVYITTADWNYSYYCFYDEYTHCTPFTKTSLEQCMLINGFRDVRTYNFTQLPFLWINSDMNKIKKFFKKLFRIIPKIIRFLRLPKKNKLLKHSRELVLVGVGKK